MRDAESDRSSPSTSRSTWPSTCARAHPAPSMDLRLLPPPGDLASKWVAGTERPCSSGPLALAPPAALLGATTPEEEPRWTAGSDDTSESGGLKRSRALLGPPGWWEEPGGSAGGGEAAGTATTAVRWRLQLQRAQYSIFLLRHSTTHTAPVQPQITQHTFTAGTQQGTPPASHTLSLCAHSGELFLLFLQLPWAPWSFDLLYDQASASAL